MESFLIIANPAAGWHAGPPRASQVCELLRAAGKRVELKLTAGSADTYELAQNAVRAGVEVVVGAGGDGTLQQIARALEGTDAALGIIPAGCCNDFARTVGLFRSDSAERLAETLIRGRPQAVDLGRVGAQRFLTVATFGLASAVNRLVETGPRRFRGRLAYLYGLLRLLFTHRATVATVRGDFGERSGRILVAAIGNTPFFAGNLRITPGANCHDGLFQVCLVEDVSRLRVLAALGIIPAGCCNDFARTVGLFRSDSPERLANVLIRGQPQAVDLGGVGAHRFLTVATFGLASAVNRLVEGRPRRFRGRLAYLYGLLRLLFTHRATVATLRGDFGERSGRILVAAIGNTPSCAGNLRITPGANCRDGLFQVCLVEDMSRLTVLAALGRLWRGTHLDHPAVQAFQTGFLEIETAPGADWICADGESLCPTPCRLEVRREALRVMAD